MELHPIFSHPSVVIVQEKGSARLLMAKYDGGYPLRCYRGSFSILGGNPTPDDVGPRQVLKRRLGIEFKIADDARILKFNPDIVWADIKDINLIRDSISRRAVPIGDYLMRGNASLLEDGPYYGIASAFLAEIPGDVFKVAEMNLERGRQLTTEGFLGIVSLDDLTRSEKGEYSTAYFHGPLLNDVFGSKIPFPNGVEAMKISSTVREEFEDYFIDFTYRDGWNGHRVKG